MSILNIREQKYFLVLRNTCLLAIFVFCESIQLLIAVIWLLNSRPLTNAWASRIFPEGLNFVSPERETLLFYLLIIFAVFLTVATLIIFRKILKTNELVGKYGFSFAIEGLLTFFLLSAGFKMTLYSYRPQLAHE